MEDTRLSDQASAYEAISRQGDQLNPTSAMQAIRLLTAGDSEESKLKRFLRDCKHNHDQTHGGPI
jgi:hypothetical protein